LIEEECPYMKSNPEAITKKHPETTHSDMKTVVSHIQRPQGEWIINSLMIEGCAVPFKYKRKKAYKDLKGQRVNLTYYPATEMVADIPFDVMNVVRIRIS